LFEGLSIELHSIDSISVEDIDIALRNYNFENLNNLYRDANNQFRQLDEFLFKSESYDE